MKDALNGEDWTKDTQQTMIAWTCVSKCCHLPSSGRPHTKQATSSVNEVSWKLCSSIGVEAEKDHMDEVSPALLGLLSEESKSNVSPDDCVTDSSPAIGCVPLSTCRASINVGKFNSYKHFHHHTTAFHGSSQNWPAAVIYIIMTRVCVVFVGPWMPKSGWTVSIKRIKRS